ncbi:MAG: cupin domain-containing protein [Thermodesulfobacteria bacterium]|nr:cupin domain-containing protein [Thermodesulfobacteriota bacterium]
MNTAKVEKGNIFSNIPDTFPEEIFETLLQGKSFRLERILSKGHRSPQDFWYDQAQDEWVIVLRGRATLRFAKGQDTRDSYDLELGPGDYVLIPSHLKHRVERTTESEETVWLAIHYTQ